MNRHLNLRTALSASACGFLLASASAAQDEENIGRLSQPLVNGQLVTLEQQRELGLVRVASPAGGCSGTLLNRYVVLTADHCVTTDGSIGGTVAAASQLQVSSAWAGLTVPVSEVFSYQDGNGLDVALVFLGQGDFGPVGQRLIYHNVVDDSMTLTIFGAGISAFAVADPPTQAAFDGLYRNARFTPEDADEWGIDYEILSGQPSINGGDSGGPSFVTTGDGGLLGIAAVNSSCDATGYVDSMPQTWLWATGIDRCYTAALYTIRSDIISRMQWLPIQGVAEGGPADSARDLEAREPIGDLPIQGEAEPRSGVSGGVHAPRQQ